MTAAAPDRDDNSEFDSRRRWLWAAAVVSSGVCGWLEVLRLRHIVDEGDSVIAFLLYWDMETTLPFVVLLLLPILIWLRSSKQRRTPSSPRAAVAVSSPTLPWTVMDCVVIGGISICCSWQIGSQQFPIKTSQGTQQFAFTDLPPAYHDEYSYLLQARTFLDARLSYPPMAVRPDLFHQFHVEISIRYQKSSLSEEHIILS